MPATTTTAPQLTQEAIIVKPTQWTAYLADNPNVWGIGSTAIQATNDFWVYRGLLTVGEAHRIEADQRLERLTEAQQTCRYCQRTSSMESRWCLQCGYRLH